MKEADKPSFICIAGILAGGQSRRMGRPKAGLEHPGGGTLIEHVVRTAGEVAERVVIVGRSFLLPSAVASLPVVDDVKPQSGPLAGLFALLMRHQTTR